jgi:hypothetical protein
VINAGADNDFVGAGKGTNRIALGEGNDALYYAKSSIGFGGADSRWTSRAVLTRSLLTGASTSSLLMTARRSSSRPLDKLASMMTTEKASKATAGMMANIKAVNPQHLSNKDLLSLLGISFSG